MTTYEVQSMQGERIAETERFLSYGAAVTRAWATLVTYDTSRIVTDGCVLATFDIKDLRDSP